MQKAAGTPEGEKQILDIANIVICAYNMINWQLSCVYTP